MEVVSLGMVLAVALTWRAWERDRYPLWVDEAESCINALTILDHGVPVSHYLGIPIYENTLIKPWPESEEYEFRDLSYSSQGLAVYHGWLPLYSIAAAFWLTGIKPDQPSDRIEIRHSLSEMLFRTRVARTPALVFSLVFLLALFWAGREMFDPAAGWAALLLGAFSNLYIWYGGQARYYSATIALSALCLMLSWLMLSRGRWRHFLAGALSFVFLFHTHMISSFAGGLIVVAIVPLLLRHKHALLKLAAFFAIVFAGTVPWMILTGFLNHANGIPRAWSILQFPQAITDPLLRRHNLALPLVVGAAWLLLGLLFRKRLPAGFLKPLFASSPAILFLAVWLILNFLSFTFLIPAASYFYFRLVLGLVAPGVLLSAAVFSAMARLLRPRHAVLGCVVFVVLFFAFWADFGLKRGEGWKGTTASFPVFEMIEHLRTKSLRPGTRIYATPSEHLTLTFYTGLPIQSVAPVRKSFLESYPGDVIILECFSRYSGQPMSAREVARAARQLGQEITQKETSRLSNKLRRFMTAAYVESSGANVSMAFPKDDPLFQQLASIQALRQQEYLRKQYSDPTLYLLWQGFEMPDFSSIWPLFFYRFSEPERRLGPNVNYARRIKGATASVLRSSWVAYDSPGGGSIPPLDRRQQLHCYRGASCPD